MLRERLKEMDFKITELAEYLQVSRPTMYKFIDCYDNSEFDLINPKVLKLFNYINEHELAGKKNVLNYLLSNTDDEVKVEDDNEVVKQFKSYVINNPRSKKSKFLVTATSSDYYDNIIFFLEKAEALKEKDDLTAEEEKDLFIYYNFVNKINGGR